MGCGVTKTASTPLRESGDPKEGSNRRQGKGNKKVESLGRDVRSGGDASRQSSVEQKGNDGGGQSGSGSSAEVGSHQADDGNGSGPKANGSQKPNKGLLKMKLALAKAKQRKKEGDKAKSKQDGGDKGKGTDGSSWTCSKCTFQNPAMKLACVMCMAPRRSNENPTLHGAEDAGGGAQAAPADVPDDLERRPVLLEPEKRWGAVKYRIVSAKRSKSGELKRVDLNGDALALRHALVTKASKFLRTSIVRAEISYKEQPLPAWGYLAAFKITDGAELVVELGPSRGVRD